MFYLVCVFLSVPVIYACDHEFLLCIRAIRSCVSVCMCFEDADSAYYTSVRVHEQRVCESFQFAVHFS